MGLIWSLVWIWFYRNSPTNHRFISSTEKDFILQHTQHRLSKNKNGDDVKAKFHAPWRAILTSRACWALFIIHTCSNYGTYTFLTSIPSYMSDVLKFDVKSVSQPIFSIDWNNFQTLEWNTFSIALFWYMVEYFIHRCNR